MVASFEDSKHHSDKYRRLNHHPQPSSGLKNNNLDIQKVPVINIVHTKGEQNDKNVQTAITHSDVNADHSDVTIPRSDAYTITHSDASITYSDPTTTHSATSPYRGRIANQNASEVTSSVSGYNLSDISPSILGSLFPNNPSDGEAFSQHFNLEYLEDSFVFNLIENTKTDDDDDVNQVQSIIMNKKDILSDALAEIVNETSDIVSKKVNEGVKTIQKGRKRGRKLGYRSQNSNGDNALCGICGAKVRISFNVFYII